MYLRSQLWWEQCVGTETVCLVELYGEPFQDLSYSLNRYLEQVEHRLADVEEEISRLKRLIPASFLQGKQHVLFPRSISGRTDDFSEVNYPEESLNVEDGSVTQGITPDATDGVGTIEFTTDESWAYFGMTQ